MALSSGGIHHLIWGSIRHIVFKAGRCEFINRQVLLFFEEYSPFHRLVYLKRLQLWIVSSLVNSLSEGRLLLTRSMNGMHFFSEIISDPASIHVQA
jgi:hypothetical protein